MEQRGQRKGANKDLRRKKGKEPKKSLRVEECKKREGAKNSLSLSDAHVKRSVNDLEGKRGEEL